MIFWTLIGIAVGYFFHAQIDRVVYRVVRAIRDNRHD